MKRSDIGCDGVGILRRRFWRGMCRGQGAMYKIHLKGFRINEVRVDSASTP